MGDAVNWGNVMPRSAPVVGAVYWEAGINHVSYVESVNPDGSVTVSEANYQGWNQVSYRTVFGGVFLN